MYGQLSFQQTDDFLDVPLTKSVGDAKEKRASRESMGVGPKDRDPAARPIPRG
jgi:hypothetical protein